MSLHCPYSETTHHLIDAAALARMKPSAYLVNTARGPIVDEAALVEALRSGQIAGAALDVFEHEPDVHPGLLDLDNVGRRAAPRFGDDRDALGDGRDGGRQRRRGPGRARPDQPGHGLRTNRQEPSCRPTNSGSTPASAVRRSRRASKLRACRRTPCTTTRCWRWCSARSSRTTGTSSSTCRSGMWRASVRSNCEGRMPPS